MTATVMITTGGTGGHVFPGLAVAAKLIAQGSRVFWLGTREGIESKLVPQHRIDFESMQFGGVRGKGWKRRLLGPFSLVSALIQSYRIIRRRRPDVVLGLGGFVSFPGGLIALICRKPLAIHDANAVAGLANRILAFGADRVLLGFPGSMHGEHAAKTEWVGNPLRDDIAAIPPPAERFGQRSGRLRLLVVGGSLGARALNEFVPAALALLDPEQRPHVVHQSGAKLIDQAREAYARAGVDAECLPFIDDMALRYAEADLVICRGGALTVSELAAVGVGSLIVPLPGAIADEQSHNAKFLVDEGAAVVIQQSELNAERLATQLRALLLPDMSGQTSGTYPTREKLLAMATAARRVGRTDAAARVADTCIALAGGRSR